MKRSVAVSESSVLSYKFCAPAPDSDAILREGILHRIAQSPAASVILIQGPAGHGKSTALQQLKGVAEAEGALTGWMTLDAGDNDPHRFFSHFQALVANLRQSAGFDSGARVPDGETNYLARGDWTIERLLTIGQPVSLYLDEMQTVTDKTVLSFLKNLFERAARNLRIFVGSRSLPDVGLARLVVNNRAVILHGDDLRFTPQEVEQFFAGSGDLGIDLDEVDAIYHRTEGWPAAVQLFRLALGSPLVRKSLGDANARAPRELAEYLAENVLSLQEPQLQDFLLRTSLLTRLSGPLCDAVLKRSDSEEVLRHLERSGLFLRCVDPQAGWYKYHSLFSSIVADQLRLQSTDGSLEVHRGAARWFMKKGLYEDAVAHATNCGEHALAADALNMWATQLVAGAHLRTLEFWSERVPLGEIAQRPDLAIKCVYALVFLRRWQRARPLLDLIGALPDTGSVSTTTDPKVVLCMAAGCADEMPHGLGEGERTPLHPEDCNEFAPFELGAAANLRACCALSTHDFEKAREHLMIARVYNERIEAAFSRGYTSAVGGVALLIQGSLQEALAKFREGLAEQRGELDNSFALAALISCYVWALYEANELDTAEKLFRQHHDVIGESTLPDFLTVAYLSIARLHDARGRPVKSEAILDEAEAIGRDNGWSRLVSIVNWERVRRHIVRGAADQALRAAAPAQTGHRLPRSWIPFGNDVEDQELGEIRLALAQGSLDEVGQRIDEAFKRQRGRTLRQIKLHLLHAHQGVLQDDNGSARRALRAALRLARPGRFIRCILDEGPVALQLLHDEYQRALDNANGMRRGSEIEFLELLLKASGTDIGSDPAAVHAMLQPLTNREREMLVLLANGISNKDMASRLFVSENTVKFHLKSIYAKLSVTSRVQATTVARQIGILA